MSTRLDTAKGSIITDMRLPALLLATLLTIPTQILVLKSGARLAVDKPGVSEQDGRVLFRSGGALYSLAAGEVDFDATRSIANSSVVEVRPGDERMRIKVSEAERRRLLRELEENHRGRPAWSGGLDVPRDPSELQTPAEKSASEEWSWRRQARAHEEEIRQTRESLQFLHDRVERLRAEIRTFVALGVKSSQITYQATELQYAIEAIPSAELSVERAERSYAQFRDDARRLGVMPGWLR